MSGGGSKSGTSTTTVKLPKYADDALRFGKDRVTGLYKRGNPTPFFPGATYANLNSWQNEALGNVRRMARRGGSGVLQPGIESAVDTLSGNYLDPRAYDQAIGNQNYGGLYDDAMGRENYGGMYDSAMGSFDPNAFNDSVMALAHPELNAARSGFEAAGRTGSGLAQEAETDAISRAFASMYGSERDRRAGLFDADRNRRAQLFDAERDRRTGMFGDERDRMLKTGALLPQFEQAAYSPMDRLMQAGGVHQQDRQGRIDDSRARWEYTKNLPYKRVDDYLQRIQGVVPGDRYGSTSQPTTRNPLATGIGGALTGYKMTGSPFGAAAGLAMGLLT